MLRRWVILSGCFLGVPFALAEDGWSVRWIGNPEVPFRFHRSLSEAQIHFLTEDLRSLAQVEPAEEGSSLHHRFFGGPASGRRYLDWIAGRIRKFRYQEDDHLTAKTKGARVRREVALSQHYFTKTNRLERWSILIHEARHFDRKDHVLCTNFWEVRPQTREPLAWIRKQKMCDADVDGAFGAQIVFLANVLRFVRNETAATVLSDPNYTHYVRFIPYPDQRQKISQDILAPTD